MALLLRMKGCVKVDSFKLESFPWLGIQSIDIQAQICDTIDIILNINGTDPPFTFQWYDLGFEPKDTTITNLEAGSLQFNLETGLHIFGLTDSKGCEIIDYIDLIDTTKLSARVVTNYDCTEEIATVEAIVSHGQPPYQFSWNNGDQTQGTTQLKLGESFSVTITDAEGCVIEKSGIVSDLSALEISLTGIEPSCSNIPNGKIFTRIENAREGEHYKYLWNTGDTTQNLMGLPVGSYEVTVTDANGCGGKKGIVLWEGKLFSATPKTVQHISCYGETDGIATVDLFNGRAPFKYRWSDGQTTQTATNLCAGEHSVTVIDANGCEAVINSYSEPTISIREPQEILMTTTPGFEDTCDANNGSASISIYSLTEVTPNDILWSNGQIGYGLDSVAAGKYFVTVTDVNGCSKVDSVEVYESNSFRNIEVLSDFTCGNDNNSFTVTVDGRYPPFSFLWHTGDTSSTITNLAPGSTYTITVTDANGCSQIQYGVAADLDQIDVNLVTTDISCSDMNNGALKVELPSDTNYNLLWSTGETTSEISGLSGYGIYSVTVYDDNGCGGFAFDTLRTPSGPFAIVDVIAENICRGDNFGVATASPLYDTAPPYSYLWDNGETTATATMLDVGPHYVTITDSNGCTGSRETYIRGTSTELKVFILVDQPGNCRENGAALTASPVGGYGPYIYAWSNGATTASISDLQLNTYSVTVTDTYGCSREANIEINEQDIELQANAITLADANCKEEKNGQAFVAVEGGTPPYIYSWSNGQLTDTISNLNIGTYHVTVEDANGCQAQSYTYINEPALGLSVLALITQQASCEGEMGKLQAVAEGGIPPYTYLWSNGIQTDTTSNQFEGQVTYSVTVEDAAGCQATDIATIEEPKLNVTIEEVEEICGEHIGLIKATVQGGIPPYTYYWSNGTQTSELTHIKPDNYSVTIYDSNGCQGIASVTLEEREPFQVEFIKTAITCEDGAGTIQAIVTGAQEPIHYEWSRSSADTSLITTNYRGTHFVTITDGRGCAQKRNTFLSGPSSLNPRINITHLSCADSLGSISVNELSRGTPPYFYTWSTGDTTSSISNLSPGYYSLTIEDSGEGCEVEEIVIENREIAVDIEVSLYPSQFGDFGQIVARVSGQVGIVGYIWNTGDMGRRLDSLSQGYYEVTATDYKGCQAIAGIQLDSMYADIEPLRCSLTVKHPRELGDFGEITAIPMGGTFPYTYIVSNGATTQTVSRLTPGQYSYTITDANGVYSECSATILPPPECQIDTAGFIGSNQILCGPSSIMDTLQNIHPAEGGEGNITYQWYRWAPSTPSWRREKIEGANGLNYHPGKLNKTMQFYRTAKVEECYTSFSSNRVTIEIDSQANAFFEYSKIPVCVDSTIELIAPTNGLGTTYEWTFDDEALINVVDDKFALASWPSAGEKQVSLRVENDSCVSVVNQIIRVSDVGTYCEGFELEGELDNNRFYLTWALEKEFGKISEFLFLFPGNYGNTTYTWTNSLIDSTDTHYNYQFRVWDEPEETSIYMVAFKDQYDNEIRSIPLEFNPNTDPGIIETQEKLVLTVPNPFIDGFTLRRLNIKNSAKLRFMVQSITGQSLSGQLGPEEMERFIDLEHFPAGIYFIQVEELGKVQSLRMIKTE